MTATASRDQINASLHDLMRCLPSHIYSLDEIPSSVPMGFSDVCSEQFSEASGGKNTVEMLEY